MEWLYPKRRAPRHTMSTSYISAPPLHFLMIFGIVITLLWFSQYTDYKSQLHHAAINFHFFLLFLPILLILLIVSNTGRLCFRLTQTEHRHSVQRAGASVSPWGVAILVLLLLILLWNQSSFQSNWFGPLWRSD